MTHLKTTFPTWKYLLVAEEAHQTTTAHHFHAMMVTEPRLRIRVGRTNPFYLRMGSVRANTLMIKPTRPGQSLPQCLLAVQRYIKKDGDFLEEGELKRSSAADWEEAMDLARTDSVKSALLLLAQKQPRTFLLHADSLERSLKRYRGMHAPPPPPCKDLASFTHAPEIRNPDWHVLIFAGLTGMGKTQWARALLPHAPVVRHLDVLTEVDTGQGVIFDDLGVGHLPFTALLNLLDWEEEGQVHVRYTVASIAPRTRRIFTTNQLSFSSWVYYGRDERKMPISPEQFAALGRRMVFMIINERLF